jgi:hypothetical protein
MAIEVSAIIERIDGLLGERGETRRFLVAAGAVKSVQNITAWIKRGTLPRSDIAVAIAKYLGVSVIWLLTGEDERGMTRDESNLLVKYQSLMPHEQKAVQSMISGLLADRPSGLGKEPPQVRAAG